MGTTTFSGPVKSGNILETGGANLGTNISNVNWLTSTASIYVQSPSPAAATAISLVRAITTGDSNNNGSFTVLINGTGTTNGSFVPASSDTIGGASWARKIMFTSTGNDSALRFTVTGTNANGQLLTESNITGPNAGTSFTSGLFKSVTSITSSAVSTGSISVGIGHTAGDQYQHAIGVIPYGSALIHLTTYRYQAWNGGGNEVLEIGTTLDVDQFGDIATATNKGAVTANDNGDAILVDATQWTKWLVVQQDPTATAGNFGYEMDCNMIITYTPSGTLATTGKNIFVAEYAQKRLLNAEAW